MQLLVQHGSRYPVREAVMSASRLVGYGVSGCQTDTESLAYVANLIKPRVTKSIGVSYPKLLN